MLSQTHCSAPPNNSTAHEVPVVLPLDVLPSSVVPDVVPLVVTSVSDSTVHGSGGKPAEHSPVLDPVLVLVPSVCSSVVPLVLPSTGPDAPGPLDPSEPPVVSSSPPRLVVVMWTSPKVQPLSKRAARILGVMGVRWSAEARQ